MTLETKLNDALADWRTDSAQQKTVTDDSSGWTVRLDVTQADGVGCKLTELALTLDSEERDETPTFADRVENICGVATGLLEPLRSIETDEGRGEALFRSERPTRRDEKLYYYELLVRTDGGMSLRRYEDSHQPKQKRQAIEFSMTDEALARLAHQLTSAW